MKTFATTAVLLLSIILKTLINSSKMKTHLLTLALSLLVFGGAWGQTLEWAKRMGGTSGDYGNSIALDASGNVYTTGAFQGTVDFDPGASIFNLTSAGGYDIFISKLDPSGNFLWAKSMGSTSEDKGYSIALDASGNVYTTGHFSTNIFISKLDPSGNFLWTKVIVGSGDDYGYSIALDASGNVYTTGFFQSTVDFDPGPGIFYLTFAGGVDIFISKFDSLGNFIWAKRMGSSSFELGHSIALDSSGNVYTTGYFSGTVDFDPGAGTFNLTSSVGGYDIFISKLDSSGNFIWAKRMGSTSTDYGYSIALDASGNVYTTGIFGGTVDFDPGSGTFNLTSGVNFEIFISKLDSSGNFLWAKAMGASSDDNRKSIALDASGNAYTTGNFQGTVDFDPGAGTFNLTPAGYNDIFVCKLNPSGNFLWAKAMGGTLYDYGNSIALDASGNAYTTGYFSGTADFDPDSGTYNLTSAGNYDIFILKLKQQGITGYIFNDLSQNCQRDSLEIGIQNRFITINPGNIIAQTNESGVWVIDSLPIGTYTATIDTSGNWSPTCPVTQTFTVTSPNEITYVPDFGLVSTQPCASPDVSVNMPIVRRCFSNQKVYVNACNQYIATGALNSTYADIELDSLIITQSASLAFTSLGNNSYRFQLGTLNPGQCVNFTIDCQVSCNASLGQTLCMEANLYPADSCVFDTITEIYPGDFTPCTLPWDKSSLQVEGYCQNDSIYFVITNTGQFGNGNMDCFSPVRIFIDGVYTILDSVKLVGGESIVFAFAGDGRTWRLEADQHPLHPGNSHPNATVEACGNLSNWTPDLVNVLPQDDADPIVDIYCGVVTGSYDPNDKTGYPTGVTANHYIYPNQQLQYNIRFQNTGTDTAFTVVVRDTLDMDLDIFSVVPGVASHNYNFQMYGPRVLEWTFYNIQLPDSNANEAASHGFCTFTVNQNPDLPNNTEIRNSADIYFDYNAPVITNQTLHTVYEFRQTLTITDTVYVTDSVCDSYFYNGFTYNNTGTYYQTNNDTLTIINLTIKDSTVLNLSIISCADYELNGIVYDSTGFYKQVLVNSEGCDSIINLDLNITTQGYNIDTNISICQGDSIFASGAWQNSAGIYYDSLLTVYGCDSIVSLELTINVSTSSTTNVTTCDSFTWTDGNTYTTSGTYTQTLINSVGCDSVATLELVFDNVYIPDANFKAALVGNDSINTNGDSEIQCDEAASFSGYLNVSYLSIADLTGIEAFTALDTLYCYNNQLTSLDVSANMALTYLNCRYNQLIDLNISANTLISYLNCYGNQLTSLDVSADTALNELYFGDNQLTNIDVSANTSLIFLSCVNNQLTSLDVSTNTVLTTLNCNNNLLTSLDVSANTILNDLSFSNNQLTSLNLSANTALTQLFCYNNQLTSLNLSANTALTQVFCINNQLTSLDVSANTALIQLFCDNNQLTSLDVSANTALYKLLCNYNQLTSLNVKNGNNANFLYFQATNNPNLTCINVDNAAWSTANWTNIDSWASFSDNCYLGENSISHNQIEINIYPNPTTGKFYISVKGLRNEASLNIIDVTGKVILNETLSSETTTKQVDFSTLPKGIYAVKVVSGDVVKISRIVVQ